MRRTLAKRRRKLSTGQWVGIIVALITAVGTIVGAVIGIVPALLRAESSSASTVSPATFAAARANTESSNPSLRHQGVHDLYNLYFNASPAYQWRIIETLVVYVKINARFNPYTLNTASYCYKSSGYPGDLLDAFTIIGK